MAFRKEVGWVKKTETWSARRTAVDLAIGWVTKKERS